MPVQILQTGTFYCLSFAALKKVIVRHITFKFLLFYHTRLLLGVLQLQVLVLHPAQTLPAQVHLDYKHMPLKLACISSRMLFSKLLYLLKSNLLLVLSVYNCPLPTLWSYKCICLITSEYSIELVEALVQLT